MSALIEANELRQQEIDNERKEAVEKIWVLRDIIRDLEAQVEAKTAVELELRKVVVDLENAVRQQTESNVELNQQLDSIKGVPDAQQFQEHIARLEDEVQRLRLNSELAGSEGALRKFKSQVSNFDVVVEYLVCFLSTVTFMKIGFGDRYNNIKFISLTSTSYNIYILLHLLVSIENEKHINV